MSKISGNEFFKRVMAMLLAMLMMYSCGFNALEALAADVTEGTGGMIVGGGASSLNTLALDGEESLPLVGAPLLKAGDDVLFIQVQDGSSAADEWMTSSYSGTFVNDLNSDEDHRPSVSITSGEDVITASVSNDGVVSIAPLKAGDATVRLNY